MDPFIKDQIKTVLKYIPNCTGFSDDKAAIDRLLPVPGMYLM